MFKINNFILNSKYSGKKARIKFANDVNAILGINNFDEQSNYKKVSRWITNEAFPDFITILAISKVMGITIDQLFENNLQSFFRIDDLSTLEISTLKSLILNSNENAISRTYIPYSFQDKRLEPKLLNRNDVINYYKEIATKCFSMQKLKNYVEWISNKPELLKEEYFDRFCSVEFIEDYSENTLSPIIYTDTDDYYEKISKVWQKHKTDNFYNVIFFNESIFDSYEDNTFNENGEKAFYFKTKAFAEKTYTSTFASLIDKGLITPSSSTPFTINWDDGSVTEKTFNTHKNISIFTDDNYEYVLSTISFSFKINLSEIEMKEILLTK